jgi:hypothetical protein
VNRILLLDFSELLNGGPMKKTLLAVSLSLVTISSYATSLVTCEGITNSDHSLILGMRDGRLLQVRVQAQGSLPHVLLVNLISSINHTSLYTITGSMDKLEIANSVLREEGGQAIMAGEQFNCAAN